jgi:hypothetical protein
VACTEDGRDPLSEARAAVERSPQDSALRIEIAKLELARGRGDLAEIELDRAVRLGADASALLAERALALRLQGRIHELLQLPVPTDPRVRSSFLKILAPAQLEWDGNASSFLMLVDEMGDDAEDIGSGELGRLVDELRRTHPSAERAFQHQWCARDLPDGTSYVATTRRSGALQVGRGKRFESPADAAAAARDGDVVELDAGEYIGGVARWPQNRLTVRGVGDRAHVRGGGKSVAGRDVWLFEGDDVVVENIEISGADAPAGTNGAAIRHIGRNLTLRHVFLHDSENGLMTGNAQKDSNVLIVYSEFARNGNGTGDSHNIYIGRSGRFEIRFSYSRESDIGHLVKSRARETRIMFNYLADGTKGRSSYAIDAPDGGDVAIVGNVIDRGALAENKSIVSYGAENRIYERNSLLVKNNTIYSRYVDAEAVRNHTDVQASVVNNLLAGAPMVTLAGPGETRNNGVSPEHGLVDPRRGDYGLRVDAREIDAGGEGVSGSNDLVTHEYVHPVSGRTRKRVHTIDIGAYERCGYELR